jgi:hypothetical protein
MDGARARIDGQDLRYINYVQNDYNLLPVD